MSCKRGDLIVSADAYVHVLSKHERKKRCDACFKCSNSLKKCSACGIVYYCNVKCQQEDYRVHKEECCCLKQMFPRIPTESVRLLLRLVIRHTHGDEKKFADTDTAKWRTFNELQTHVEEIKKDTKRMEVFTQLSFTLHEFVGDVFPLPEVKQLLELFGKMAINSFTICDAEMQAIGTGIYLSPSLLDHSCQPNAVATFTGKTVCIRAVENIEQPKPSQVFISYIDQLAESSDRRRQLEEQYYFTCQCSRCMDRSLDAKMQSVFCDQLNCKGILWKLSEMYVCQTCKVEVTLDDRKEDIEKRTLQLQELVKEIDKIKKTEDPDSVLLKCEEMFEKQQTLFPPVNVHMLHLLERLFDSCVETGQWEKACQCGSLISQPYCDLYPPYSPAVGIHLLKLGKVHLYLQHLEPALRCLQQAETIISVTHGKNHQLYKDLQLLLDQCCEEMRVNMDHGGNT